VNGESPEWDIDYELIVAAHLGKQPSRVRPGVGFAIPMSKEQWWAFPRMPGWRYEYFLRRGALTGIRPFGPHYRIAVEPRNVVWPCEIRSVKRSDVPALRQAFAEAFVGYTDYIYTTNKQRIRLAGELLGQFFSRRSGDLCRKASCLAIEPGGGRVIGAALLAPVHGAIPRPPESATQLQPVFVVPAWRRRGVATALVSEVLRRLWSAGQEFLISGCSDYNIASKRWHLAFSATEELRYSARFPIFAWVRNEIGRKHYLLKMQGIEFDSVELMELERALIGLANELDVLEEEHVGLCSHERRYDKHSYRDEASRYLGLHH
jgi:GNAT superfamily N-acetyltransferase